MHRFVKALVCALVMFTVSATASAEASYSETYRLVRSMRADELLIAALHASLNGTTREWTKEQAACLSKVKYPLLTDAVAVSLAAKLTDAEVADAIGFYRSDAGRKFTEQTFKDLRNNVVVNVDHDLNAQERRELAEFANRPAGRKLVKEQIVNQADLKQKVALRLRVVLDDCEYQATKNTKVWSSSPVRAPGGTCSAVKKVFAYGEDVRTEIVANCATSGFAFAHFKGRIEQVGFRWLGGNALEVIHPAGATPSLRDSDEKLKITYRQRTPTDPPAAPTWPQSEINAVGRVDLDGLASQPFWMSYVDGERCLLSKKIERSKLPGNRNEDEVVQFMKLAAPEYPFGTTQLVLFETASGYGTKSVAIRGAGMDIAMNPGGSGFHLSGKAAETVLRAIAGGQLKLVIEPTAGTPISIDLAPTDFAWALPPFERCISG